MADFSNAADAALTALNTSADGGFVEEYQHRNLRVRRGRVVEQVQAIAMLQGLAARAAAGGPFRGASIKEAE